MSYKVSFLLLILFALLHLLDGKTGPSYSKKELGEKVDDMGNILEELHQLCQQNFLLTMREIEKLKDEVNVLKEKVGQLEAANLSLHTKDGNLNDDIKVEKPRKLKKSRSVPMGHSQQLIYSRGSKFDSDELGTQVDQVFMSESINSWDANACHTNIKIMGRDNLVVEHVGKKAALCSVFAKSNIFVHNFGIFYFEVELLHSGQIVVGLAPKGMPLDGWLGYAKNTYGYSNGGYILVDGINVGMRANIPQFGEGDTVGCGVNLMTGQLIYALNGEPLDTHGLLVVSPEEMYPCVTLWSPGSKIKANFGPNFNFGTLLATIQSSTDTGGQWARTSSSSVETIAN